MMIHVAPPPAINVIRSSGPDELKQDLMDLVLSLQSGNRIAANAAFQAFKRDFQQPASNVTDSCNSFERRCS